MPFSKPQFLNFTHARDSKDSAAPSRGVHALPAPATSEPRKTFCHRRPALNWYTAIVTLCTFSACVWQVATAGGLPNVLGFVATIIFSLLLTWVGEWKWVRGRPALRWLFERKPVVDVAWTLVSTVRSPYKLYSAIAARARMALSREASSVSRTESAPMTALALENGVQGHLSISTNDRNEEQYVAGPLVCATKEDHVSVSPPVSQLESPLRHSVPAMDSANGHSLDNDGIPPTSVLVVDDNPINVCILSAVMRKKKIKYDVANNGEEAVQKWQSGSFQLILMDIDMPIMNGIEATKEIRRLEEQGDRRDAVIITALINTSLMGDRDAALAAGCNDILCRPISLQLLASKIIECTATVAS